MEYCFQDLFDEIQDQMNSQKNEIDELKLQFSVHNENITQLANKIEYLSIQNQNPNRNSSELIQAIDSIGNGPNELNLTIKKSLFERFEEFLLNISNRVDFIRKDQRKKCKWKTSQKRFINLII